MDKVPFHSLYKTEECLKNIEGSKLENGFYKKELIKFFENEGFQNIFLTDSCTRALEIAAYCLDLSEKDEVIVPSFGYVSTADAFAKIGCKLVFADSQKLHPNISIETIVPLITPKTKAVVCINYGGFGNELADLRRLCDAQNIVLIEDNAHGIGAKHYEKSLGTFGHFSALSFHETKNIHCFNGGLLAINDNKYFEKAISYYNKGTDRHLFQKGSVEYYQWISNGNSCEMSVLNQGFLYFQSHKLQNVSSEKLRIWNAYESAFNGKEWNFIAEFVQNSGQKHNAHIYPICFKTEVAKINAEKYLLSNGISAYSHYHSLDKSKFGRKYGHFNTPNADNFSKCLLRLPIYLDVNMEKVIDVMLEFG